MKAIRFTLIVALAAALLAPAVGAQDDAGSEGTVIELESHNDGGFFFTLAGETEKNPDITVPAGEQVTLRLTNVAGFHNIGVSIDGVPVSDYVQEEGDVVELTFTTPAEGGVFEYFCEPHRGAGMDMKGALIVGDGGQDASTDAGDSTGDAATEAGNNNAPGAGAAVAVLALAGLAALVGRRQ